MSENDETTSLLTEDEAKNACEIDLAEAGGSSVHLIHFEHPRQQDSM